MRRLLTLAVVFAVVPTTADIVVENEPIIYDEIFDLEYALEGKQSIYSDVVAKYYCVFRSNWSKENHPEEYPPAARWSAPLLFSHTKQYVPALKNKKAPNGVEQLVESKFATPFLSDVYSAGEAVLDYLKVESGKAEGFFVNQQFWDQNYVYLDPIKVSAEYPFLSSIAAMVPSPDWFTQFYLFQTYKDEGLTFWDSFKIQTFPWDAGSSKSDAGGYDPPYRDTDPAENIERIDRDNAPKGKIFLAPNGGSVRYVAEWECVLHTCPPEDPDCKKENWPPPNGCDILRYPQCAEVCNPELETCEQCRRVSEDEPRVFRKDCCLAGRVPKNERDCGEDKSSGLSRGASAALTLVALAAPVLVYLFN